MGPTPKHIKTLRVVGIVYGAWVLLMTFLVMCVIFKSTTDTTTVAGPTPFTELIGMAPWIVFLCFFLIIWPWFLYKPVESSLAFRILNRRARGNLAVSFNITRSLLSINYCGSECSVDMSKAKIKEFKESFEVSTLPSFVLFIPKRIFSDTTELHNFKEIFGVEKITRDGLV